MRGYFVPLSFLGFLLVAACNSKLLTGGSAASATPTPPDSVLQGVCSSLSAPGLPADPADDPTITGGNGNGNGGNANNGNGNNSELALFLDLSSASEKDVSEAAKKLLRHAATRGGATLESAIHAEGTLGDFRVLNDLDGIVVNRPMGGGASPTAAFDFGVPVRAGAASAIGRIIEQDRSAPPGRSWDPADGRAPGIAHENVANAIATLELASCIGTPIEIRGAAIEALGLIRDASAKPFLDVVVANPGEGSDANNLFLQIIAARSLTNITLNNHVISLGLMPKVDALFEQAQGSQATP